MAYSDYLQNQPEQNDFWNSLGKFFVGSEGKNQQVATVTPQQMQAIHQLLSGGLNQVNNPTQGFEPIEQQAKNNFQSETIPSILQQFAASGGNKNSSGLQGALGAAGGQLQQGLAALKAQFGLQNQDLGLRRSQLGLTNTFENQYQPGTEGVLQQILPLLADAGLMYATGGLTGSKGIADLFGKGVNAFKGSGQQGGTRQVNNLFSSIPKSHPAFAGSV